MPLFDFGGNLYDIDDSKIALNNGDGTFGPKIDVPSINEAQIEWATKNQTGRGDGVITALASAIESANVTITNLSIKRDNMVLMFPADLYSYGTTPNRVDNLLIEAGRPFPYFSLLLRCFDGENPNSGGIFWFPKIKVMQNVRWTVQYNQFIAPQIQAMAVQDTNIISPSGRYRFCHIKSYESNLPLLANVTLPMVVGT